MKLHLSPLLLTFYCAAFSTGEDREEILSAHNWYRSAAQPPAKTPLAPLQWSESAEKSAERVAADLSVSCTLHHSTFEARHGCGENLGLISRSTSANLWHDCIGLWGDEREDPQWRFGCAPDDSFPKWGHYTQVRARDWWVGKLMGNSISLCVTHFCENWEYSRREHEFSVREIG